jgi:hypothetical protein
MLGQTIEQSGESRLQRARQARHAEEIPLAVI